MWCELELWLASAGCQILLCLNLLLDDAVSKVHCIAQFFFADFAGTAFNHDGLAFDASVNQVDVTLLHFSVSGVGDELAIDAAYAQCTNWCQEWNVRNGHCAGRAQNREYVRLIIAIAADDCGNYLNLVHEAFREQRADWPVCHSGGEDFLFGWPAFPLEVAAWYLACRGKALAVFHRQREEVNAFAWCG